MTDYAAFYKTLGLDVPMGYRTQQLITCAFHAERNASLSINFETGLYNCFSCGAKGDAVTATEKLRNLSTSDAIEYVAKYFNVEVPDRRPRPEAPKADPRVARWHENLLANEERLRWLITKRGITIDTVKRFKLGWVGDDANTASHRGRLSFPVLNADGSLSGIRLYRPDHGGASNKVIWADSGSATGLYPLEVLKGSQEVVLCEGELDAMLANQWGIPALTGTAGATTWKDGWSGLLRGKSVAICYDNDDAGEKGSQKAATALSGVAKEVRVVRLPIEKKGGDVTDWILEQGGTREKLAELIQATPAYVPAVDSKKDKKAAVADNTPLQTSVMSIQEGKTSPAVKAKAIGDLVLKHLATIGKFYIDKAYADGMGAQERVTYFFDDRTRDLFNMNSPEFDAMLYEDTWVNPKDQMFGKIKAHLHMLAVRAAQRVSIHSLSYYDKDTKTLYVHRGGNRVYVLSGGLRADGREDLRQEDNGTDGVLFRRDSRGDSWEADEAYTGAPLLEMFDEVSSESLRLLLAVYCVLIGFANVQRTKLIVTFVGDQGSGKSYTARRIGRLWCGPRWQVTSCEPDRENDAVLSLTTDRVTCFDNLDTRVPWVQDKLALAATGAQIQRRALYTDSDMIRSDIVSFIIVTSREPKWIKREDVVQRMLPIHMTKREEAFLAEDVLEEREVAARGARMGHLLDVANGVVRQLRSGATAQPTRLRIADFAFMGELAAKAMGKGQDFLDAVAALPDEQRTFLVEDHPVLEGIEEWLAQSNYGRQIEISELYREISAFTGWNDRSGVRNAKQMQQRIEDYANEIKVRVGPFDLARSETGRPCIRFHRESDDSYVAPVNKSDRALPF